MQLEWWSNNVQQRNMCESIKRVYACTFMSHLTDKHIPVFPDVSNIGSIAFPISRFPYFAQVLLLRSVYGTFLYFLPIIHFITSPPFLSAVFYHTYYHFLERVWEGWREGKKTVVEWTAVQPIQQISITWYAWSGRSHRVINWHVAAGQVCIALVRCPQCNKIQ